MKKIEKARRVCATFCGIGYADIPMLLSEVIDAELPKPLVAIIVEEVGPF